MFQLQKLFHKFSLNKFITKCSLDSNVKSVLNNRFLLYALSLIVFLDLIYLANSRCFNTIIIFFLVGFLTSFFCKNMIVIMVVALFIAHILKNPSSFEGAANMDEEDEEEDTDENYENKEEDPDDADNKKVREELKEFATVQKEIIDSMTKLEPLMNKAEGFIEKLEKYKQNSN